MHVILKNGWQDRRSSRAVRGFEEFRATVENTRRSWSPRSPASGRDLHRAAEILARNKPMAVIWAMGITQHTSGVLNVLSLANLQMLLGNLGVAGRRGQPAPRPEQRPGGLRHGRAAERVLPATSP